MRSFTSVDELFDLLESGGATAYFGEPVSLLEHSLQTAWFAQKLGADDALITASLLHDLGHLLHTEDEDAAQRKFDTLHENMLRRFWHSTCPPPHRSITLALIRSDLL